MPESPVVEVPGGVTRAEHIAACLGCQQIRAGTGFHVRDLTCFEIDHRATYVATRIARRLDYDDLLELEAHADERGINLYQLVDAVLGSLPDVVETNVLTGDERADRRARRQAEREQRAAAR